MSQESTDFNRLNKQNDRVWALYNPREYRQTKVNGDEKAMVWVGLVGGQIIARYWFLDPDNEEENIFFQSLLLKMLHLLKTLTVGGDGEGLR